MTASSGSCVLLPWDSQFFGVPIGRLLPAHLTPDVAAEADGFCVREGIACLYFLAASDDVALEKRIGSVGIAAPVSRA